MVCVLVASPLRAQTLQQRMLAAEDARVTQAADMAPLAAGLRSSDPRTVVQAVRALGRFERPELVRQILPLVTHPKPEVRAEALNALGQALAAIPRGPEETSPLPPEAATVRATLAARLRIDPLPYVTGVAAETLGRLPYRSAAAVSEAAQQIAMLLPPAQGDSPVRADSEPIARVVHPAAVTGAVKGLETLIRVYQKLQPPSPQVLARLRGAATLGSDPSDGDFAFIRRVAWLALNAANAADAALIEHGIEDPDPQIRRLAVLSLGNATNLESRGAPLLARALKDHSFIVRYDAVRVYSRTRPGEDCSPILAAADDENGHVAVAAIDALGSGCAGAAKKLIAFVDALPDRSARAGDSGSRTPEDGTWHRAAHAIVSLARVARDEASHRLARFAEHPTWQVRMYAAQAATALAAAARLERLAADAHDNVREAALHGLFTLRRHDADGFFIDALSRPDYQVVRTAAKLLEHSPDAAAAAPALIASFTRISAEQRDTSRDARMALLDRIAELGSKEQAPALQACLSDRDPHVAGRCAVILHGWTGRPPQVTTHARAVAPVGVPAAQRMRITMRRGGSFDLRLFADEAPATVARVLALARKEYYNGLTFHRVVPNFVLQGGSPGANEYVGDGPFMRDELGLRTHARGTLGISTRGRDTGDAQIFINLVDNPRLDHNFTVFAEVTAGMDAVDAVLEGDVIDRVEVLEPPATQSRP